MKRNAMTRKHFAKVAVVPLTIALASFAGTAQAGDVITAANIEGRESRSSGNFVLVEQA
jgi:hypothetical protein